MEKIKIRNNERRTLIFRVPKRNIRLAPRESIEIPKSCLEAQEVKKLLLQNSLTLLKEKEPEKIAEIKEVKQKQVEEADKAAAKTQVEAKAAAKTQVEDKELKSDKTVKNKTIPKKHRKSSADKIK